MGGANREYQKRKGREVAVLEPDSMRNYLLKHELSRGGRLWCDRVIQGVERGERTAMRLYGEAMKWVGAQGSIAAVFIASLNVRSEDELRSLVESGRRLERLSADSATSLEEYRESALDLLKSVLQQKPEWRNLVLARLGSHAEEASGAHTNGTEASAP